MSTGTVTFAGAQAGYGNKVEIRYWDGTVSYYGHMDRVTAHVGQKVAPGQRSSATPATPATRPARTCTWRSTRGGHGPVDPVPWLQGARHAPVAPPRQDDRLPDRTAPVTTGAVPVSRASPAARSAAAAA